LLTPRAGFNFLVVYNQRGDDATSPSSASSAPSPPLAFDFCVGMPAGASSREGVPPTPYTTCVNNGQLSALFGGGPRNGTAGPSAPALGQALSPEAVAAGDEAGAVLRAPLPPAGSIRPYDACASPAAP
jgi:hypothetical protein